MNIVTKVMEKSWKFVGKNVYEPCHWESYLFINTVSVVYTFHQQVLFSADYFHYDLFLNIILSPRSILFGIWTFCFKFLDKAFKCLIINFTPHLTETTSVTFSPLFLCDVLFYRCFDILISIWHFFDDLQ